MRDEEKLEIVSEMIKELSDKIKDLQLIIKLIDRDE